MPNSNALATTEPAHNSIQLPATDPKFAAEVWEFIAGGGDLEKLDDAGKAIYYRMRCEAVGLDPATFPFQLIKLSGKLTLYATKAAIDQLCQKRDISTQILDRQTADDVHIVLCRASMGNGRFTDSTGAVTVAGLKNDALCNALMKAETKAKHRAVLALTGMGALDESELETIPGAQPQPLPAAVARPTKPTLVQPEVATREQIIEANEWRRRAVAAGYVTANGTAPKAIGEGELLRNVTPRMERWKDEALKLEAEEMGEPNMTADEIGPQTIDAPDTRGQRYPIPANANPRPCSSCQTPIYFAVTGESRAMPIEADGYSHFPRCPQADAHRKPRTPKTAAVEAETGYADAKPKMTKHLAHLWAVAGANGLKSDPREERIANSKIVLMDHEIEPVESWNDLDEDGARCLAGAIDAKILTWGEPNPELPLEGDTT